ncbi:hypothetical protein KSP35_23010 [Aquihabitans sp. G128]|uniref:hypothetical protein n=1 Tax=Aquihabitans sp. G128 TaxID=2849779 RepID=UPI001C250759|nr:hypothetical protein [Aquihabitans sp. G128]QXC61144.1 hypothetical protein KSP35_23010 [Aquihabitans sp. G128]
MADAEAERTPRARRPRLVAAGLAVALLGTIGVGWRQAHRPNPAPTFCTADGYLLDDGTSLQRDPDRGCRWVDEDGTPATLPRAAR